MIQLRQGAPPALANRRVRMNERGQAASFRVPTERREQRGGWKGRWRREAAKEERVEGGKDEGEQVEEGCENDGSNKEKTGRISRTD